MEYKKHKNKIIFLLALLASPSVMAGDIYDVLRGTRGSSSLNLSDTGAPANLPQEYQELIAEQQRLSGQGVTTNPNLAQQSGPQAPPPVTTSLREEAFKEYLTKTFPLTPEQYVELHQEFDKTQAAINTHPVAPPQPISSTLTVDLSPGATPPVIRIATGFVTSVVFVDSTGASWPIADYSLGNPAGFNLQWDTKTNSLFIQGLKDHITGNMAVRLAKLKTPIMISLVTGQRDVDFRVDLQVPGRGPNATAPIQDSSMPNHYHPSLLSVLDGVPPAGSTEISVGGGYGRAWLYQGKLLFRTKLTLLSPAWTATVSSADGTRVYELVRTPMILASKNGKPIKIELAGM